MAVASILCRFEDVEGAVQVGQPVAWDEATAVPTKCQLLKVPDIFGHLELQDSVADVKKCLAPLEPLAIQCIGLNYAKHAAESKMPVPQNPVLFNKYVGTLNHPHHPIVMPKIDMKLDWEVELAVIIGRRCKDVGEWEALDYVLGYTVANDVSARYWQIEKGGGQWNFGKSFDTFTPLGPVIATKAVIPDPQVLQVRTTIDGKEVQKSDTSDMVFGCAKIVSFLSQDTTLLPGTVILTGTPFGVGLGLSPQRWLKVGETVCVEIERIGRLFNKVAAPEGRRSHFNNGITQETYEGLKKARLESAPSKDWEEKAANEEMKNA